MPIYENSELRRSAREDQHQIIAEAIAELEQQHADGVIETPAYLLKKRALIKRL